MSAGKGDKPRHCFSKNFKNNFDNINWTKKESPKKVKKVKGKTTYVY